MATFLLLAGCSKRPVLYPNEHYEATGSAAAEEVVEYCMEWAKVHTRPGGAAGKVAGRTAEGAVTGGAAGGAAGAVTGRTGERAAAGAAAGATVGFFRGIFKSRDPDPIYARFVERCLREAGYDPIGWR